MVNALHNNTEWAFDMQLFAGNEVEIPTETVDTSGDNSNGEEAKSLLGEDPIAEEADKAEAEQAANEQETPVEYESFKLPEGMEWDTEKSAPFIEAAKEMGLSQENAQKLVDIGSKLIGESQDIVEQAVVKQAKDWYDESVGKFQKEDIALADKTLRRFADEGLISLLRDTGMANNPQLIGMLKTIGEATKEGSFVDGRSNNPSKNPADILFDHPTSKQK